MLEKFIKDFIKKSEKITKQATRSKSSAIKFLIKGGFLTKSGKLKKEYHQE